MGRSEACTCQGKPPSDRNDDRRPTTAEMKDAPRHPTACHRSGRASSSLMHRGTDPGRPRPVDRRSGIEASRTGAWASAMVPPGLRDDRRHCGRRIAAWEARAEAEASDGGTYWKRHGPGSTRSGRPRRGLRSGARMGPAATVERPPVVRHDHLRRRSDAAGPWTAAAPALRGEAGASFRRADDSGRPSHRCHGTGCDRAQLGSGHGAARAFWGKSPGRSVSIIPAKVRRAIVATEQTASTALAAFMHWRGRSWGSGSRADGGQGRRASARRPCDISRLAATGCGIARAGPGPGALTGCLLSLA